MFQVNDISLNLPSFEQTQNNMQFKENNNYSLITPINRTKSAMNPMSSTPIRKDESMC